MSVTILGGSNEPPITSMLIGSRCGGSCNFWVGLTRTDGVWMFTDGTTYDYVPPDEWFNGNEMLDKLPQHCARLIPKVSDICC